MQALGSYKKGKMLFLGLGTGLGSTLIVDGIVEPMELGHLPYKKATYEDYVGARGLDRLGKKRWRNTFSMSLTDWSPRSNPTISCSAAATRKYTTSCRGGAGWATTRMHSEADFLCGRTPRELNCRPSNWALGFLQSCVQR